MTRSDAPLSRRPQEDRKRRRDERHPHLRMLLTLPVVLLLAGAPATPALAAGSTSKEGLSGYTHTETTPKTQTTPTTPATTPTTPSTSTAPTSTSTSPSTTTPAKEVEPSSSTHSATTPKAVAAKAGTLPFTGFDLRWTVGFGLLLLTAGGSIILIQRRARRVGR